MTQPLYGVMLLCDQQRVFSLLETSVHIVCTLPSECCTYVEAERPTSSSICLYASVELQYLFVLFYVYNLYLLKCLNTSLSHVAPHF